MKKTLVALAVLAATGSSFAQVVISGKLGFGAQRNPVNATAAAPTADAAQGMIMTDGEINFAATEDLGGGMKITAQSQLRLRGREDSGAYPRNASIALTTGFGVVGMGAIEAPTAILGGFAGAPVELSFNADGNSNSAAAGLTPLTNRANIDFVNLTMPVGPVIVTVWHTEVGASTGNATGLTGDVISARYSAGPLTVFGDYTNFQAKLNGSATQVPFKAAWDGRDRYRAWANYDFGVAKVGVGYTNANKSQPDETSAGLSVPMGAVVFGLTYAQRAETKGDATIGLAASKERTFTGAGVQYNFSKMTNLNVSYGTFTGPANVSDEYRIRLLKNF
jgi:predicted porin